jgi:hypothetical protein
VLRHKQTVIINSTVDKVASYLSNIANYKWSPSVQDVQLVEYLDKDNFIFTQTVKVFFINRLYFKRLDDEYSKKHDPVIPSEKNR